MCFTDYLECNSVVYLNQQIADQHYRLKKSHGLYIVRVSTSLLFQEVIR